MVLVEPYSAKTKGPQASPAAAATGNTGNGSQPERRYNQMSADEKVKLCCKDFNKPQGCSRGAPKCR